MRAIGSGRLARSLAVACAAAATAGLMALAGPAQAATQGPDAARFDLSSVGWTGSSVIVAGADSSGDLYYWYQPQGTTTWHQQLVASGLDFDGTPQIDWAGSTVIMAVPADGGIDYFYQYAGTRPWHQQQVAAAGRHNYYGTAIGWTGSTVVIASVDESGDLDYFYQYAGTAPWHEQQVSAAGVEYYDVPAIDWTGSSLILADLSVNGSLDYWWQAAGTRPWRSGIRM